MKENIKKAEKGNPISKIEQAFWTALDLDKLEEDMLNSSEHERDVMYMGTGFTQGACYICGSSSRTHGNAGCC